MKEFRTLKDLGLDDDDSTPIVSPVAQRVCRHCSEPIENGLVCESCQAIANSSSSQVSLKQRNYADLPSQEPRKSIFPTLVIFGFVFVLVASIVSVGMRGGRTSEKEPTYQSTLQAFVDDFDASLKANVFGTVSVSGWKAKVVVESDFFMRLEPDAQRLAIEKVRDTWKGKMNGGGIEFITWNGVRVASFD